MRYLQGWGTPVFLDRMPPKELTPELETFMLNLCLFSFAFLAVVFLALYVEGRRRRGDTRMPSEKVTAIIIAVVFVLGAAAVIASDPKWSDFNKPPGEHRGRWIK